ncbi:unnamed protein product [Ectocarpus sp. 12 AP-2014]
MHAGLSFVPISPALHKSNHSAIQQSSLHLMYAYSVGRALYSSSVPEFGILSCFVRVWCISEHLATSIFFNLTRKNSTYSCRGLAVDQTPFRHHRPQSPVMYCM